MTKVNWHQYPDEMPDSGKDYLVTIEGPDGTRFVCMSHFMYLTEWIKPNKYFKVIAWAELPEPYKPEEPEDNHPDAITARKYAEGDPETVKALHIFDE